MELTGPARAQSSAESAFDHHRNGEAMGRKPELEPSSNDVSPGRVFRILGGFLDLLSNLAEQGGGVFELRLPKAK